MFTRVYNVVHRVKRLTRVFTGYSVSGKLHQNDTTTRNQFPGAAWFVTGKKSRPQKDEKAECELGYRTRGVEPSLCLTRDEIMMVLMTE